MAHMIENNEMFSVREVPWHGLGTVIENAPNSEEAIKLAGLNWTVRQEPVCRQSGEAVEPHLFNIREDTDSVLGIVTNQYHIVQNDEAFAFTDALIGTGQVKYETAGALNGGKRIWLLARLPEDRILGDLIVPYLVFTHGHDGRNAVKCALTADRVVCHNTLTLALGRATRTWTARHFSNIVDRMDEAQITLNLASEYMNGTKLLAEELALKKLSEGHVDALLTRLFPEKDKATLRNINNVTALRRGVSYRYNNAPDLADYKGTGWGLVMAVSDFLTHAEPTRKTARFEEARFESAVDGMQTLDRAVELVRAA